MTDWLERYLDVAALDTVGAALLGARPAFVAGGAGGSVIAANPQGLALFGARSMAALAAHRLGETSRLRAQLVRLAGVLPADRARLEALVFPLALVRAACRRVDLADGTLAVLAVADAPAPAGALRARAEQMVLTLAAPDAATAVIDGDGQVIAASDGFDAAAAAEIAPLARALGSARRARHRIGNDVVEVVALGGEDEALHLVVVSRARDAEPMRAAVAAPAASPATVDASAGREVALPVEPRREPPVTAPPLAESTVQERLSGTEADAFRRIREVLTKTDARLARPPAETALQPKVEPVAPALPETARGLPAPPPPPFDEKLLDRLPLGIVLYRDHRILFANRALLDLLGFESADGLVAAGGVDAIFADGSRVWATGDFDDRDGRLAARRRDGTAVPVEARLKTVTYAGETAFMLSLIPRRVAVEAPPEPPPPPAPAPPPPPVSATAAERRIHDLETILNTATDGVITVDRHGMIESMNRAAEALFAVDVGDFRGRSFTELLAEESRKTALDYLDGLAANGVQSVLNDGREVIGRVPHGGLIPLFMTMGRLGDSGRFSMVLRDITHWKTIEEELTAARREAEAANAQKSEFLAKISHEIRTPLNAIIGFSEIMMEQRFGPIGNDRYRAYLSDIHVSGAHLMSLINDLLDLSKIEAGKVDLTFESVAVNALIQECVALMQPLANRQRIIIRTSLGNEIPNVVADQRSFRQILLNLLSNAIKFTRAGGQVIVSTLLEDSGEVVVRIRDTGIGMTAKEVETAMKPFEQVAKSQSDRDKGTGLGLPLTRAMVEANRAAFAIESAPNQGTLVKITFPTTRVLAG